MKNPTVISPMVRCFVAIGLLATVAWHGAGAADNHQLLFTSQRIGNPEIFLANADGTGAKNLTNNPAEDTGGAWSPDGKQIVFASDRTGGGDLYIMDADGGNVRQLTSDPAKERA